MLDAVRFFGPYAGFDEPSPDECWFHTAPLPNGRRMRSNRIENPDAQNLMWKTFEIESLSGKKVLDIGAADGFFSLAAKAMGAEKVTALDLNYWGWPQNITNLSRLWNAEIDIVSGDFQILDFEDKFDLVLFLGVLYHLENVFHAFRKLRSLLATNGVVIMETQMSQTTVALPAFECASDIYPTIAKQGKEAIDAVGVSNYLFPNHAAIANLADTYSFNCERLIDNDYIRTYPTRGIYRLTLK